MNKLPLFEYIRQCAGDRDVIVALSGGVKSALVLAAARISLGDRVKAVTAETELSFGHELSQAQAIAASLGVSLEIMKISMLENEKIKQNGPDRCYWCTQMIVNRIMEKYGDDVVIMHGADVGMAPESPCLRALEELKVQLPLRESNMKRAQAVFLARNLKLPCADSPAQTCRADHVAVGVPLQKDVLNLIELLGMFLHANNVTNYEIRVDDLMITVTYPPQYKEQVAVMEPEARELITSVGLKCRFKSQ